MIFKGIFILSIIFSVQNGVKPAKKFKVPPVSQKILFDITDLKSLKNFIRDSYNISRIDYKSFDKLTLEEKNATAHKVFRNAQSLIKDITAIKSDDESIEELRWDKYVLSKFKPIRSEDRDKIIDLNGRIKSALKHVKFYVNKLDSSSLTYTQNYRHGNYCMHALALYEYSLEDQFRYNIKYDSTDLMDIDNVRQLFLDLTHILSKGEIKEKNSHDFCDKVSSFRQEHYNLYIKVVIASFNEFSVNYFAAMGQAICQPSSYYYKHDLLRWEENFINSLKLIIDKTKAALNATEHYMYTCQVTSRDRVLALKHVNIEDELDLELGGMMQTIIIPEQNLSSTRSCSDNCNVDFREYAPNKMGCDEIMDCQYISSSYEINYLTNSSRRYSHFIGDNRTEYGDKYRYSSEDSRKSQVASTYSSGGLNWCDYCICTCKKNYPTSSPHTATTISFLNQVSDIRKNKAVTGLKFVKKDHMIQIQILEGQILPYGKIGNESWQSLDKIRYNETTRRFFHVSNDDFVTPLERSLYGHPHQTINLNDVIAPEKHVITGVSFHYANNHNYYPSSHNLGPIELQIRVTPFDFVRGQLINIEQSRWISPKEKVLTDELILENPDNPLYPPEGVEPIITSNKFVKFRVSDLKKDAGQSTVPFFSSSPLKFSKSSLLGGIGLIHFGHPGSGGRIALKMYDFNTSPYFNSIDE